MSENSPDLVTVGVLAAAGYLGYQYWWKPHQLQVEYDRQLAAYMAANPGTNRYDAIAAIGEGACRVAGLYYGGRPGAVLSGGVCKLAGVGVSALVRSLPGAASATYGAGKAVVRVPVKVVSSIASGARSVVSSVGSALGF